MLPQIHGITVGLNLISVNIMNGVREYEFILMCIETSQNYFNNSFPVLIPVYIDTLQQVHSAKFEFKPSYH